MLGRGMPRRREDNRPVHVERMIDQQLHAIEEMRRVRQRGVQVERGLVDPARVDEEQFWVAHRTIRRDRDATRFKVARDRSDVAQRRFDRGLMPVARMEADKDDEPAAWSVQPIQVPDSHG